jgi:CRISPR/Cas system-associated exonuclease Cas4 (RecB family)
MAIALIVAAVLAAVLALALFQAAGPLAETEPLLVDEARRVRGRPDYLLRHKKGAIPVELKPLRTSRRLYESDRLQIATYLMLVRDAPYGIVRYKETTFRVYLTKELEARCLAVADEIRAACQATVVHRTHNVPAKCRACAHKAACGESLV